MFAPEKMFRRLARQGGVIATLIAVIVAGERCAQAGSIIQIASDSSNSTEGLGAFTGSLEYNAVNATLGTLTVSLTNTSPFDNGGFITGFLFNLAGAEANLPGGVSLQSTNYSAFQTCTDNGLSGQPFGNAFDGGAAIGGSFLGGGSPQDGVGVGQTGVFNLNINSSAAGSLDTFDFILGGEFEFNFLVRFRGFENEGSDKVPAMIAVVPLPAPVALGTIGLIGVALVVRRFRRTLGVD